MRTFKYILLLLAISLSSCGVSKYATISQKPDLSKYRYVYIAPTSEKTSVTGGTYGNQYGVFGSTSSKSINPADVISGVFMKHNFVRIPEIGEAQKLQTIVVNYGESGRKNLGYSIEVTIQLLDASTYDVICTTSAEGMGDTETDSVRKATLKCLDAIFN